MQTETQKEESQIETTDPKIIALAKFLECDADEISESRHDDCVFEYGNQEYLVCDDIEADQRWDQYLDSYIDDCVLPNIPEAYRRYFNSKSFKYDCSDDGRGHSLAGYDGHENKENNFFIYRIN